MRNLEEARKEALEIIKEDYDLVLGEAEELLKMDEWRKVTMAFYLGVTAGAKSTVTEGKELMDKLRPEQRGKVIEYMQKLLMEEVEQ